MIQFIKNDNFGRTIKLRGLSLSDEKLLWVVVDQTSFGHIENYKFDGQQVYKFLPDVFYAEDFWHWHAVNCRERIYSDLEEAKTEITKQIEKYLKSKVC